MAIPTAPRVVRGLTTALMATLVALIAHLAGGGDMPGVTGIAVPLLLSLPFSLALAGKKLSVVRTSLAVAISQILFHALFVLGTPIPASPSSEASLIGSHAHHGTYAPALADSHISLLSAGETMWAGHVLAGAITVAYLLGGDQLLRQLRSLPACLDCVTRRLLRLFLAVFAPVSTVPAVPTTDTHVSLASQTVLGSVRRRGPPFILAA
ncbi:hypothetical protein [Neomicrococcus aestuarii]|uniref:Uncharacterized protein n=1 Tax=Neomicrococcus aestuarii TaxID=556325 RepID=A0A1L2ZM70_9MICC|nr:hypothetical protein [Neomicrococcus aestuarii]APF40236.1 hypothetical protein BHE16_03480 [Neomicrococcus aestuarii]